MGVPLKIPRFTANAAARIWGLEIITLQKRLNANEAKPDKHNRYSIREIDAAVHGSMSDEKLGLVKAQREAQEMENEKEAGNLVDLQDFMQAFSRKAVAVKQLIMSRVDLTDAQKEEILQGISDTYFAKDSMPANADIPTAPKAVSQSSWKYS